MKRPLEGKVNLDAAQVDWGRINEMTGRLLRCDPRALEASCALPSDALIQDIHVHRCSLTTGVIIG
jgi:hypothetical protein